MNQGVFWYSIFQKLIQSQPGPEQSPIWQSYYLGKGYVLVILSRYEDALAAIDKAMAIEPAADAYLLKGDTLYPLGRYDEALAAYNNATKLDTNNEYTQHINEMKKLIQPSQK